MLCCWPVSTTWRSGEQSMGTFAGMDIQSPAGAQRVSDAIRTVLECVFVNGQPTQNQAQKNEKNANSSRPCLAPFNPAPALSRPGSTAAATAR
jgi:hypothetical protein